MSSILPQRFASAFRKFNWAPTTRIFGVELPESFMLRVSMAYQLGSLAQPLTNRPLAQTAPRRLR